MAGPDDGSGLRVNLWGRLRPEADEADDRDAPFPAAPDPSVDLVQVMAGASRRILDKASEWAGGAGPRHE
jgi:hypothetical protein